MLAYTSRCLCRSLAESRKRCFFVNQSFRRRRSLKSSWRRSVGSSRTDSDALSSAAFRAWKRRHGTERELFFTQDHQPGERLQVDWMHCEKLEIELAQDERLDHLLVHVVLPYSNWEWARVCYSESYLSLKSGLQSALVETGRLSALLPERSEFDSHAHSRRRITTKRTGI